MEDERSNASGANRPAGGIRGYNVMTTTTSGAGHRRRVFEADHSCRDGSSESSGKRWRGEDYYAGRDNHDLYQYHNHEDCYRRGVIFEMKNPAQEIPHLQDLSPCILYSL
jgi:hypothetical protein